ncbi:MAG TPA: RNA polymerase sigma factor [Chthoniobacterales bacterium]|nr:RNA polymerase sigma factor [Chthoniobacterales bacterium]
MAQEDPDLTLVKALMLGQQQALDALMDRHREGLFRFVLRNVQNEDDALELAMETFVRAYFNIEKFRPTAKFATWLYRIALNLCRDHVRSRAYRDSRQTVSFDAPGQEAGDPGSVLAKERGPRQSAERQEELNALQKAIGELPEELKEVVILTALEDRSQAEAAELLRISVKAVEMRLYRARKLLLEKMSKMGY